MTVFPRAVGEASCSVLPYSQILLISKLEQSGAKIKDQTIGISNVVVDRDDYLDAHTLLHIDTAASGISNMRLLPNRCSVVEVQPETILCFRNELVDSMSICMVLGCKNDLG